MLRQYQGHLWLRCKCHRRTVQKRTKWFTLWTRSYARSTSTSPISCISLVKLPRNCQVQSALARLITTLFRSCPALIIPFSVKILDSIYSRIYIRTDDFKFYLKFYLSLLLYWYNFIEWKSIFRSIHWQKNRKITMIYLL